ncbi:sigma-70 family RNA polymerase sigma factor [Pseudothauera nasutitermitis]|uniref:Sigma-70 family RNA polymerase sigma factor n=1 Tax=Pseudothauera nasutitermitis TaxID=2565930 RepID=A0A4S4B5G5_9RHOO|nr:sigma-70 family RNA polymerase sigma factor [Pseudothauera nasutitermitis]THF67046.1 sigma-70 family RNA polymerase sigma factor [Pseudothauera nasutitermitis]
MADDALRSSVSTLYDEHHVWLKNWLRRRLPCADQAADLAHDTFLRVLTQREPVMPDTPRAFLTTIAQRVLASHFRRQYLEQAWLETLAQQPELTAVSEETRALWLETLYEIDRLLETLPPVVRKAFLLSQLEGLSHAQIAAELDISIATVKRHIVKAGTLLYFAQ